MSAEDSIEIEFPSLTEPMTASMAADDVAYEPDEDGLSWLTALFADDDDPAEIATENGLDGEDQNDLRPDTESDHRPVDEDSVRHSEPAPTRDLDPELEDFASIGAVELTADGEPDDLPTDVPAKPRTGSMLITPPPPPVALDATDTEPPGQPTSRDVPIKARVGFREEILATFSHLYDTSAPTASKASQDTTD